MEFNHDSMKRKLSFVIPCYRSAATIGLVVAEITKTVTKRSDFDYEIILINDGSPDNTFGVIKELCKNNSKIKGICLSKNYGQAPATLAGFAHVTGEIVVYSDDDGQTPINELFPLIDKLDEGFDMVFAKFSEKKNSWFQNFGTKVNNVMACYLIGKPPKLHFGNFWVSKKFVIEQTILCENPYPYIAGIFLSITKNMTSVPTGHRSRLVGKSNYTFSKMVSL